MNHLQRYKLLPILKWCFAVCLLVLGAATYAQQTLNLYDYDDPQEVYHLSFHEGSEDFRYLSTLPNSTNNCRIFFRDTAGTKNVRFSTVTAFIYGSEDTIQQHATLNGKCIMKFNRRGQTLYEMLIDSTGKIADSLSIRYNRSGQKLRITWYNTDSTHLKRASDEFYTWNNKSEMIKDSTWKLNAQMARQDASTSTFSYDKDGNNTTIYTIKYVKDKKFTPFDTAFYFYKYDSYKHTIWCKVGSTSGNTLPASETIWKYDTEGNEIEEKVITQSDTVINIYHFAGNRLTGSEVYENGQLTNRIKKTKQPNGDSIRTEENFGINTGSSCPDNSKKVFIYDSLGNELSRTITNTNNGLTTTNKVIHKYTFYGTKILFDSTITTEESQYRSCNSLGITINSYDAAGNQTGCQKQGDGLAETRETWAYNQQNKLIRYDEYYSCQEAPTMSDIYVYYKNGTTAKEQTSVNSYITTSVFLSEDGRFNEFVYKTATSFGEIKYVYTK